MTVCLCMIVKDEAAVIARCLASVLPLIDAWLVVDTGSTDGTQEAVRAFMAAAGKPGALVERPWVDFAANRTEALTLARDRADYSLVIDADDVLAIEPGFALPDLIADAYDVAIRLGGTAYARPQLFANRLPWRYRGVLHEFADAEGAATRSTLDGVTMVCGSDGARRHDPETYRRDAAVLVRALETEADPLLVARYTFYLAQSLRDAGDREGALARYVERAGQGFWQEEQYISYLAGVRLMIELGRPLDAILDAAVRGNTVCPARAEIRHAVARHLRLSGDHAGALAMAEPALGLPEPAGLFVEGWIYAYGLADEAAVASYWSGRHADALRLSLDALAAPGLPDAERARLTANARFAAARLGADGAAEPAQESSDTLARLPSPAPRVLVAILAKQKAPVLPQYLRCIEALDYPKDRIVLSVRTNDSTDDTAAILRAWVERVGAEYAAVEFDDASVDPGLGGRAVHDWTADRLAIIGRLREASLERCAAHGCGFYFVADCDNFVAPSTLRDLVALDLPIVAPLVRELRAGSRYANYHAAVDAAGYFAETPAYDRLLERRTVGVVEVPVVHCTYLVRADVAPRLRYVDGSGRYEYVIFSEAARRAGIPQYLDNRRPYGFLTLQDDQPDAVADQLARIAHWHRTAA